MDISRWQTFSFKGMHAYLWFLMALSLFGGGRRDWLNMAKKICVGCWQVEMETDKKGTTAQRMLQGCPKRERSHPCDCVKQNTHIRYSSYLTKPYLIFILARFALVLIQTIQFSISGTYCSSCLYIKKFLLSSPQLCYKNLRLSFPKHATLRSYLPHYALLHRWISRIPFIFQNDNSVKLLGN